MRRVMRCRNVHKTPETRYLIDTRQVVDAFRASDDFDRELVAIYHSHPRSQAYPSPTDVAQAPDPTWHYVIVSLRDESPTLRSYRIVDGKIDEEQVGREDR